MLELALQTLTLAQGAVEQVIEKQAEPQWSPQSSGVALFEEQKKWT